MLSPFSNKSNLFLNTWDEQYLVLVYCIYCIAGFTSLTFVGHLPLFSSLIYDDHPRFSPKIVKKDKIYIL